MHFNLVSPDDVDPELLCPLCQNVWDEPVELKPCGHIFCKNCVAAERVRQGQQHRPNGRLTCPTCGTHVEEEETPNRFLVNIAEQVQVQCSRCGWAGPRGMSSSHAREHWGDGESASEEDAPEPLPASGMRGDTAGGARPTAAAKPTPAPPALRRAPDDSTESALMRNFETIDNDELQASMVRQPSGVASAGYARHDSWDGYGSGFGGSGSGGWGSGTVGAPTHLPSYVDPGPSEPWRQYGMEQSDYDLLMGVFLQFDDAGIHELDRRQLCHMLTYLNFVNNEPDGQRIFHEMDTRHRGVVSFHEVCVWLREHRPNPDALYGLTPTEYTQAILHYRSADPSMRGVVDWNGFQVICDVSGLAGRGEARAWQLFTYCDDRRCGLVSLHQYLSLLRLLRSGAGPPGATVYRTGGWHSRSGSMGSGDGGLLPQAGPGQDPPTLQPLGGVGQGQPQAPPLPGPLGAAPSGGGGAAANGHYPPGRSGRLRRLSGAGKASPSTGEGPGRGRGGSRSEECTLM